MWGEPAAINSRGNAKRGNPSSDQFATWEKEAQLKILASMVGSDLSDLPVLIDETVLPADIWTIAQNGGGDLRFATDFQGTNRIAIEVVTFNTGTQKAEIWINVPSVSSTVDTSVYFWYGKAGVSQPAVGAAFGQYAVWSPAGYNFVCHMNDLTASTVFDSTVNANTFTKTAANQPQEIAGKIGQQQDFTPNEEATRAHDTDFQTNNLAVQCWTTSDNANWNQAGSFFVKRTGTVTNGYILVPTAGAKTVSAYVAVAGAWRIGTFAPADITIPHLYKMTYDGSTVKLYVDGVLQSSDASGSGNIQYAGATRAQFIAHDGSSWLDGKIDEVRFNPSAGSDDLAAFEYNNQNSVTSTINLQAFISP